MDCNSRYGTFVDPSLHNTQVENIFVSTNVYRWTVVSKALVAVPPMAAGQECVSTFDVNIINDSPSAANVGADQAVCAAQTQLVSQSPTRGTGTWSQSGGALATLSAQSCDATGQCYVYVTDLAEGSSSFVWTMSRNMSVPHLGEVCELTDTIEVVNNAVIANAGSDVTICDTYYPLNANTPPPGAVGTWSAGGFITFDSPSLNNTTVRDLTPSDNLLNWTVTRGVCSDFDVVNVYSAAPTTPTAGTDQLICQDFTNLAGNLATVGTGNWTQEFGTGATIATPSQENTAVSTIPTGANTFRWTISNTANALTCIKEDDVVITNNSFAVDAGTSKDVCLSYDSLKTTLQ